MDLVIGGIFQRTFDDANYHPDSSILGNDILSQIFVSLVRQLATFTFQLELQNASFLDVRLVGWKFRGFVLLKVSI